MENKQCSKCKQFKLKSDFYENKKTKDGLQSYCISCKRVYQRNYMNEKYKEPKFYEIQQMRNSLSRVMSSSLYQLKDYLGCSKEFFNVWLDYQRWLNPPIINDVEELDHVLPVAKLGNNPYVCFNWKNIRPISKTENRHKRDKVDYNLYLQQLQLAQCFIYNYYELNDELRFELRDINNQQEQLYKILHNKTCCNQSTNNP